MSVQIIEKSGKPEYAVIPYAEYQELLEMAQDARDIQDADVAMAAILRNHWAQKPVLANRMCHKLRLAPKRVQQKFSERLRKLCRLK